jgi:methionine-rich copper-binding protein CopC
MKKRVLIALSAILFFSVSQSLAHSSLVSATPAEGSVLTEFPTEISLTFNESLIQVGSKSPNQLEVFDSSGAVVTGDVVVTGAVISAPLTIYGNGEYQVKYRVVSQDGHVITDSYSFNVESEIATAVPISAPVEDEGSSSIQTEIVALLVIAVLGMIILLRRAGS